MRGTSIVILIACAAVLTLLFYALANLYAYAFARPGRAPLYREFYECGFKAVPDVRVALDIQFGLLGLIFIIYDMEIVLLTPLLLNSLALPGGAHGAVGVILLVLGLSYWYEWERCALHWSFS
jgi:NADH-quinone oxidoreductase subunit A